MIYAQAVDFKPVMYWEIDGNEKQPDNAPPNTGTGQHNYSSSYDFTLPRKRNVTIGCQTTFEVQNTDKDYGVAINDPNYDNVQIITIDVKG